MLNRKIAPTIHDAIASVGVPREIPPGKNLLVGSGDIERVEIAGIERADPRHLQPVRQPIRRPLDRQFLLGEKGLVGPKVGDVGQFMVRLLFDE